MICLGKNIIVNVFMKKFYELDINLFIKTFVGFCSLCRLTGRHLYAFRAHP